MDVGMLRPIEPEYFVVMEASLQNGRSSRSPDPTPSRAVTRYACAVSASSLAVSSSFRTWSTDLRDLSQRKNGLSNLTGSKVDGDLHVLHAMLGIMHAASKAMSGFQHKPKLSRTIAPLYAELIFFVKVEVGGEVYRGEQLARSSHAAAYSERRSASRKS